MAPDRPIGTEPPWDAGGYSLPLTLDTKFIQTPSTARPAFYSESPTDGQTSASPKSPKHKFSDSRSSLSSYTSSSNNSQSHSRLSSLSTVSEFQPLTNLHADASLDARLSIEKYDMSVVSKISPALGEIQPPSPITARPNSDDGRSPMSDRFKPRDGGHRPGSPSDAVMIGRGGDRYVDRGHLPSFLAPTSMAFVLPSLSSLFSCSIFFSCTKPE